MKRSIPILMALILSGCASSSSKEALIPAGGAAPEIQNIVAGNNAFGVDLYGQLRNGDENLLLAPASISTAFGLLYPGARAETASEIARVLHFQLPQEDFPAAMGSFLAALQVEDEGRLLRINNAGWFDRTRVIEEDYLTLTAKHFGANDNRVDFKHKPDDARQIINQWVEDRTNDRVRDLLGPPHVTKETRFILVNTIYFEADWRSPFQKESTQDEPFELSRDNDVIVPMMNQTAFFRHWQNRQLQAIELPYRGNEISMVILLPKRVEGVGALEDSLSTQMLENWLQGLAQTAPVEVALKLPKLKITDNHELKEALISGLGMTRSFSDQADFSGMVNSERQPDKLGVKIDDLVHQVFLKIDEKGTEAAAATAVMGIQVTSAPINPPPPPIPFHADHPFFLLLKDNQTGAILFMGRVTDPR